MFYTAQPVSVKPHWQEYRDIKAGGKKRQDLCVNSPVPTTSGSAAQPYSTPAGCGSEVSCKGFRPALSLLWSSAAAECGEWCKNIVGFFPYHRKKNIWEQHIKKPSKQTATYEKKAAFFLQLKKNKIKQQIPGKPHIKKTNTQGEVCRWKLFLLLVKSSSS